MITISHFVICLEIYRSGADVFNATFSNISAILWRPVLVVEEAGVPRENHRPWASNWYILSFSAASRVYSFCNLQSRERTHAVLVIGLY
jgi:hypothetical protein